MKQSTSNYFPKTVVAFILQAIAPFSWYIGLQIITSIIWACDMSLRPYIIKLILNTASTTLPENAYSALLYPVLFYLSMLGLLIISFRVNDWIWIQIIPKLKKHIHLILMDRMMNHSHTLFQNTFAGSLANKINDISSGVPTILRIFLCQFSAHILALFIAIYTFSQVHIKFALGMFVWSTLFIGFTIACIPHSKKLSRKRAEAKSTVVGHIVDILSNIANVRLFATKAYERQYLSDRMQEAVQAEQNRDWYLLKTHSVQSIFSVIFQGICLWWLVQGFYENYITPGDFALILSLNASIKECLWSLTYDAKNFAEDYGYISQGLGIISSQIDIQDAPNAKEGTITKGRIIFENVRFHYRGAEPLFQNKSVLIPSGQKVGVVGYSGSGKSTFIHLILRVFDIASGTILIDGIDIRDMTQESLRKAISLIPQEPSLFHRNLIENIRYGKLDATDEEVMIASKKAHAHEFIINLSQGYQTLAGERGVKLSGGQRQRIAIARAILKNAPILILDEATSQLDSITEMLIQESLWNLMHGKTAIVVAHRLSTLLHMDRILVFDRGKIVEDGTHSELLSKNGMYTKLWNAQIGGFLPEMQNLKKVQMSLLSGVK